MNIGISLISGLLLILVLSPPAKLPDIQELIASKERQELEAIKNGDVAGFSSLLAEEAVFLNSHGPSTKAEVVKHISNFKLLDYSMADIRFVKVSSDTGLIIYKLSEKFQSQGREFQAQVNVSALWTERDGKWLCLFSQETPAN